MMKNIFYFMLKIIFASEMFFSLWLFIMQKNDLIGKLCHKYNSK